MPGHPARASGPVSRSLLVLLAHSRIAGSRANRVLADAVSDMEGVAPRDLYALYPDFYIDIAAEQKLLLEADVLVLQHPMHWYSCPPLLKEWIDRVLERGWSHGPGGTALAGKGFLSAVTTGAAPEAYTPGGKHHYSVAEFLRPFERTAVLCHMAWLEPHLLQGAGKLPQAALYDAAAAYRTRLAALRDGTGAFADGD